MSKKKYKRFYMIVKPSGTSYGSLECGYVFGPEEGVEILQKAHPEATQITYLNAKAVEFLELNQPPTDKEEK